MVLFLAAWRSFAANDSSERVQFWKTSWGVGLGMLATLSVACSGGTDATSADSTSTAPSTPETTVASTTTAPEQQTTIEVTTTTEPESATGVIVASGGVLGWFGDGAWQPESFVSLE